jgi:tetratricopeptide (TPR) repeat protein
VDFYSIAPGFMGGSRDKARAQVAAIARINPLRGHLSAARLATQLEDRAAAERQLEQAVAEFPDSTAGWLQLGILYVTTNRYVKAFETVDAWSRRQPNSMAARYQVGRIAAMSGQNLERGEAELKRYLGYTPTNEEPSHAGAWFRLGQIHEKQGRRPEALQDYQAAVRLDPTLKAAADAAARLAKS